MSDICTRLLMLNLLTARVGPPAFKNTNKCYTLCTVHKCSQNTGRGGGGVILKSKIPIAYKQSAISICFAYMSKVVHFKIVKLTALNYKATNKHLSNQCIYHRTFRSIINYLHFFSFSCLTVTFPTETLFNQTRSSYVGLTNWQTKS